MQPSRSRPGQGFLCALVLALTLCVSAHVRADPPSSDQLPLKHVARLLAAHAPVRIAAFGSSSTQGVGARIPTAAYPSQLQIVLTTALGAREPVVVLNRGIGGEDADDMARRLPRVIAEHPDLIIWQTGSNDPLRNVPIDRFVQETIAGIQQIHAAHIDVMLMGPQLCRRLDGKASTMLYRDALTAIGAGMDVPVIRRHTMMQAWLNEHVLTEQQMLSPDGLHMADAGYAKLAEAVGQDILHRAHPALLAMDTPAR
jgi:acyl-CoA thioesterase-1